MEPHPTRFRRPRFAIAEVAGPVAALALACKWPILLPLRLPIAICLLFVRDSLFGGAGIGKRITGLRVVKVKDGKSPLSFGQGIVRWLSQFIPIFNLIDAIVPFQDPLLRRYGDRWAGTRVLDSERKLAKARSKIAKLLFKKRIQPPQELGMTMEDLARLA